MLLDIFIFAGLAVFAAVLGLRLAGGFLARVFWFATARAWNHPLRVVDGDGLALAGGKRCRLHGLDAPEYDTPEGRIATRALAERLRATRQVRLARHGHCRYGRTLVTVYADGVNLNAWLVRAGLARAYTRYTRVYAPDQLVAVALRRGFWRKGWFSHPEATRHS